MAESIKDGIVLYQSGKYTDALTLFLSLPAPDLNSLEQSGAGVELAYFIGLSYARLQRYDEAILYLEQVVTSDTGGKRINQCRLTLAIIYSLTGRSRLADFELNQLLETGFQTAEVYAALAYVEWEQKNTSKTIEHYEKALAVNSNCASALNGLGYVLACVGRDLTRALSLCKRATDISPESATFLDSLGWVYYKLGLLAEAQAYIKRAHAKNTKKPEIEEHYKTIIEDSAINKEQDRLARRGQKQ